MINQFVFACALPCAGKSTYFNEKYPNAIHIVNECGYADESGEAHRKMLTEDKGCITDHESNDKVTLNIMKYIKKFLEKKGHQTLIMSADEIKHVLDGYTPEHPEIVHEQSVQIARSLIYAIADEPGIDCDLILDGGGINNRYNLSIIEELRKKNVDKITCIFFDTPIEVCLKRLKMRARKVPIDDIYKKNLRIEACKNRYIPLVDEFIRVDYFTNKYLLLDMDGTLACYGKAKLDIHGNSDFVSSELFKNLKPVKHVIEFVKEHYDMKNVYIVTACANSIAWSEKNEWLDKYFPEVLKENRMFVGNKNYKHVFIEQFANKMKWDVKDVCIIDDFHDTLTKCTEIGINAIHPSNIYAMFDKYSYQA